MEAGKLRHRLQVQSYTEAQDTVGQSIKTWSLETTRYGEVQPLQGRELFNAQQVQPQTTHKVIMRYYALTPAHRLVFNNRTFDVLSVINKDERNLVTEVLCAERL